jgi:hypothetical protein
MLLNRLASLFVKQHDLAWYWAGFVLNLFSTGWGEPLSWHSFFGRFRFAFLTLRGCRASSSDSRRGHGRRHTTTKALSPLDVEDRETEEIVGAASREELVRTTHSLAKLRSVPFSREKGVSFHGHVTRLGAGTYRGEGSQRG